MGMFPIELLKREVKLSAAASVAIVASLVFIEGLWALWIMLTGFTQYHFGFQFATLGLIGGPLLLVGSKMGYWYSLVDMTANAIVSFAGVTLLVAVDWYKFWNAGLTWGPVDFAGPTLMIALTILALWAVRVLRSADVQRTFRV